ncbi:MAG: signal peptidase II [Candidatus Omnitrophica bacterium]|nr:signal peptidase II [Candidatus Omnitrophota bacterium]
MWPFLILSISVVFVDRVLKFIIFDKFAVGSSIPIIKGLLHITPIYNTGIAFGLLKNGSNLIFIIVSFVTALFIVYILFFRKPANRALKTGLFLILGGALSNLVDRLLYGHVLDFIDIRVWPIFNVADSAITIGAFLVLFHLLKTKKTI